MSETTQMKSIELEITDQELELFQAYCERNEIDFNDWIRTLAHAAMVKEKESCDT